MWASFGLLALGLAQCAAFTGRPIHSRQTVLLAATLEPKKARPSRVKRLEDSVARLEAGESQATADEIRTKVAALAEKTSDTRMKRKMGSLERRIGAVESGAAAPQAAAPPAAPKAAPAPPKAKKAAPKKPEGKKAAPKKPEAKQPAPKQPAPKKPAPKKPAPKGARPPGGKPKKKEFAAKTVKAGDVVAGTCVAVRGYGAMIALDAWSPRSSHLGDGASPRTALLHISEISSGRVDDVAAAVPLGSRVEVAVVNVDGAKGGRVSVSTKRLEPGYEAIEASVEAALEAPRSGAEGLLDLAASLSLDDLDGLVEARAARTKAKKAKKKKVEKKVAADKPAAPTPLSLQSAFSLDKEAKVAQRSEEFELLMRDVIFEAGSLTDVKLLKGRKKKGTFTNPFWAKVFKPKPGAPPPDDEATL
jgi:predicted RNA-binding protein with RPS1 domain